MYDQTWPITMMQQVLFTDEWIDGMCCVSPLHTKEKFDD
jgi:hypothetical protein